MNLNTPIPAYRRVWIILPFLLLGSVIANDNEPKAEAVTTLETCHMQTNCRSCITFSQNCSWCEQTTYNEYRCDLDENHIASGCKKRFNPKHVKKMDKDDKTEDGGKRRKAIQMKPQRISLSIRPSETVRIPFEFYLAKDYPVDMYFLMDLSFTMKKYIDQLGEVAKDLVDNIKNLTGILHVGIGSFIDKVLLPYTDTSYQGLQNPCRSNNFKCEKPYNFKQILKLNNDITTFYKTIDQLNDLTSANLDHPEGGLDAIMQAVVCDDKIGWRSGARRLIIYISDATFHYAGDGKLGGVVIPNDGNCHVRNNMYTKAELQDYPSVGHIAQVLEKNKVTVVFAVAGDLQVALYNKLAESLEGAYVSKLTSEDKDRTIADIVKASYKNISSRVEMVQTAVDTNITFWTKCNGTKLIKSNICEDIHIGETVNFFADITGPACSEDSSANSREITISPVGLNEKLVIKLNLICECQCEKNVQPKSRSCNGSGTLTCGLCACDPGFSGKTCECNTHDASTKLNENCRPDNQSAECSNRGVCECGKCVCNRMPSNVKQTYSGKFCQCDDFSCPNLNKMLCGGPTHGVCECGKCKCKPEYTGGNCKCKTSNATCITKNNKICNGYGVCECGECICNATSGYKGRTCEDCPTCPNKCSADKECVKCVKVHEGGKNASVCHKICNNKDVEIVDEFEKQEDSKEDCLFEFEDCIIYHQSTKRNGVEIVQIRKVRESDCTKEINIPMLIAGIVGGIFLIGIIMLVIWKLVVRYYDKREMARFNEDKEKAKWTQQSNPIYEPASTTFQNPTHGLET